MEDYWWPMIPFQKTYQWYVCAVVSLTAVHGGILVTMAVCSASNHWWTYTTEGILRESFLHVSTMSHVRFEKNLQEPIKTFQKSTWKPNFPSSKQFLQVRPMSETELSEGFSEAWWVVCHAAPWWLTQWSLSPWVIHVVHQFRLSFPAS